MTPNKYFELTLGNPNPRGESRRGIQKIQEKNPVEEDFEREIQERIWERNPREAFRRGIQERDLGEESRERNPVEESRSGIQERNPREAFRRGI